MSADDQAAIERVAETVVDYALDRVRSGFESRDAIIDSIVDCMQNDLFLELDRIIEYEEVEPVAAKVVDEAIAEHYAQQKEWPAVTDCTRLDRAFESLDASWILARHHYACDQGFGKGQANLEMKYFADAGQSVRGYVFYDDQGTEGAVGGCGLVLSYGDAGHTDEGAVQIAHEICGVLRNEGLEVE